MNIIRKGLLPVVASVCLLSACGGDGDDADLEVRDNSEEVAAYYRDNPEFFSFKTPDDLPDDLVWEDGMDLPDLGSPEATKGGTFNYFLADFPRTLRRLGPDSNGSFRGWILDFMMPPLATIHPAADGYYPGLAESWAAVPEERTVYMRLDKNARWSDGEPITADDYLFMFFMYHSEDIVAPWYNNFYRVNYNNITKYDDYTISMTVPTVRPHFEDFILGLGPLPQHFFKELGDDYVERYQWRFVPTAGAYIVSDENVRKGRSITLTRIKDWWAKDKKYYRNRFNADNIRLTVIRDDAKQFEAFKRGDIDMIRLNTSELWYEKLPDSDADVQKGYIHKATFFNEKPRPTYGLWINTARPLLDNSDIRIGIHHASNWELVIEKFFRGDYSRMRTSADGYGVATHPTLQPRIYDIEKAQEYFRNAGFTKRGDDGVLVNAAGERLSFTLTTPYSTLTDVLTILKEEALKAGLEYRIEVLDMTAGFKKANEKKHDIQLTALNVGDRYPRYWETFHSDNAYDKAFLDDGSENPERKIKVQTNNIFSLADREIDELIEAYRAAATEEELVSIAYTLEEKLYDLAVFIPGFIQGYERSAFWRWVKFPEGFSERDMDYVYHYQQFWIDEAAREETLEAMQRGETYPVSIRVYDQYRTD
ncbi:MAG: extracellular solute-binding protein [Woeseiaceae bacterium]